MPPATATATATPTVQVFSVHLRDDNALFYRRDPVQLHINASTLHIELAEHRLSLRTISVAHGLGRHELVLTSRRLVLTICPTPESLPAWSRVRRLLGFARQSSQPPAAPSCYSLFEEIGRGAFGVVRRALAPDGTIVAVKSVSKKRVRASSAALAAMRREIWVACRLPPHPAIVRVVEAREMRNDFLIVMDFVPGATLFNFLQTRRPSLQVVVHIMKQVLSAVAHVHKHAIVHRDIKLENILVVDPDAPFPTIKLCDFGLAINERAMQATASSQGTVGTGYCQAPEMVLDSSLKARIAGYGRAVDVWACGIVLFIMLYRRVPWSEVNDDRAQQMRTMLELSRRTEPCIHIMQSPEERERTPKFIQSLLCGLLQPEPRRRLSARAALEHPLFFALWDEDEPYAPRPLSRSRSGLDSPTSLRQVATNVMKLLRVTESLQRGDSGDQTQNLVVV